MPLYLLLCFLLFILASGLTLLGGDPLAVALFPPPVAYYWARGARGRGMGLTAVAALVGALFGALFGGFWYGMLGAFFFALAGLAGMLMGMFLGRWSFGWCVTAFTAVLLIPMVVSLWSFWSEMPGYIENNFATQVASLKEEAAKEQLDPAVADTGATVAGWLSEHWTCWVPGVSFASILLYAVCAMTFVSRALRLAHIRTGRGATVRGRFSEMRVSEWLVWAAIGAFVLGYVDHKWPNETLRCISWNAGIALAAIYCFNGFSILVYFARAVGMRPPAKVACVLFLVWFWFFLYPMVVFFGLFDTWWDFRRRIAQAVAARTSGGAGNVGNDGPRP